jgi:ABC-2 type transport system permease protein
VNLLVLTRAVARKQVTLLVRYPVNTASMLVTLYVFFALIFFGGQALAGAAIDDSLSGIVVGFFLYTMTIVAYSGMAWDVTREAQWGTLEQLYLSPYGLGRVMAVKSVVNVGFSALWGAIILALMLVTTGQPLTIDVLTIVPVALLALAPAVGIGFVFGGLALVYKRIENVFQLLQFAFIAFIAAPVGQYPWLKFAPMSLGSHLLSSAMIRGTRLWEMPLSDLALLVVLALLYLGLGYAVFGVLSRRARRLGVLGHY